MTDKIIVLDNGSPGSRLIQEEYKDQYDIKTVKVDAKADLVEQFTKVDNKDHIKIFLPFTMEDLVENNEQLRRDIQKVEHLGFRNLIVLPYEGRNRYDVEFFAKKLDKPEVRIDPDDEMKEAAKDEERKPYKTFRTGTR
jgi:hypothetical protein